MPRPTKAQLRALEGVRNREVALDRSDIPEEAVEDAYRSLDGEQLKWLAASPPGRKDIARATLQAAAPALRKQGAEEAERKRLEAEEELAKFSDRAWRAEKERDQALAKGAEEERQRRDRQWRTALSDHLLASGTPSELAALRKPDKVQVALFGLLEDVQEALATLDTAPPSEPEEGSK